jgi:hypothetical protein
MMIGVEPKHISHKSAPFDESVQANEGQGLDPQGAGVKAWARNESERLEIEARIGQLVGRLIRRVRYFEISYEGSPEPTWLAGDFDSIDYGIEFDFDDGATWSVIWEQSGINEALLFYEGSLVGTELLEGGARSWDLTERWATDGPGTISGFELAWMRNSWGPGRNWHGEIVSGPVDSDLCLQTVVLRGDAGKVAVVTLGQAEYPSLKFMPATDNVAVFFSLEKARVAGAFLPGREIPTGG